MMSDSASDRLRNLSPAQRALLEKRLREKAATRHDDPPIGPVGKIRSVVVDVSQIEVSEPIAVIGAACRFPGADDLEQFWRLIDGGIDATGQIPASRWDVERLYDPTGTQAGKTSIRHGGFVDSVDCFDATFFGIAPREAARMDPQQRILLETVYHAIQHAGIPPKAMAGSQTGVFVGIGGTDYSKIPAHFPDYLEHIDAHVGTGNALSVAAGRISYVFDLHGPSFIVDTACSSALVALHTAVQSLRSGESNAAIVAGVNLILSPEVTIAFSKANMLSRDGRCRPFDASANGYVRGEGCAVILIKRLSDARRDGDSIMGVIRGTAVNQDGRTSGITAPNGLAQQECIRAALRQARVDAGDVSYVEGHGTATPLGDPIELGSLAAVFANKTDNESPLHVTSVKANIGHTETVSGMAGLIKVLLMMRERKIPAQLHLTELNPSVRLTGSRIQIPTQPLPWVGEKNRIAGISSFGFGGTNAHVVIESPESYQPTDTDGTSQGPGATSCIVLPVSARSDDAIRSAARLYRDLIANNPILAADVCKAAAITRDPLPRRLVVIAQNAAGLSAGLDAMGANGSQPASGSSFQIARRTAVSPRPTIAMLFTGQGSQYAAMGRQLYDSDEVFRASLDRAFEIVDETRRGAGEADVRSLRSVMFDAVDGSIDQTGFAQPAIVAFECAMVDRLASLGVKPTMVCGHSVGEYAAAYAAGVLTHQQTMQLITHRGRLMQSLPAGGKMTAIFASLSRVQELISSRPLSASNVLSVASINGPQNIVVSGDGDAVDEFERLAKQNDIHFKSLSVSHAFHSELMEPMLASFRKLAGEIEYSSLRCVMISSLTGQALERRSIPGQNEVWADHFTDAIRRTVRFDDCVASMLSSKPSPDVFVEVGPSPHLIGLMGRTLRDSQRDSDREKHSTAAWIKVADPSKQDQADHFQFASAVAELYATGADIDWQVFYSIDKSERGRLRRIGLPIYAFDRTRHWMESTMSQGSSRRDELHSLLGSVVETVMPERLYESCLSASRPNLLAEHKVGDTVVMPAAGLIEIGIASARQQFGDDSVSIESFVISQPMAFSADQTKIVQTRVSPVRGGTAKWQIFAKNDRSPEDRGQETWTLHAEGLMRDVSSVPIVVDDSDASRQKIARQIELLIDSAAETLDRDAFYSLLAARQLNYGPRFKLLDRVHRAAAGAVAEIVCDPFVAPMCIDAAACAKSPSQFALHPALLDGAMQLMAAITPIQPDGSYSRATYMPVSVDNVQILKFGEAHAIRKMVVLRTEPIEPADDENQIHGDVTMLDQNDMVVARLMGVCVQRLQGMGGEDESGSAIGRYVVHWKNIISTNDGADARTDVDSSKPYFIFADQHRFDGRENATLDKELVVEIHRQTERLLSELQQLVRQTPVQSPVLLVTSGAVATAGKQVVDPVGAALWAMGRVAQNEHPELALKLIDVDDWETANGWRNGGAAAPLLSTVLNCDENQIAVRNGEPLTARLVAEHVQSNEESADGIRIPKNRRFQLRLGRQKRISDLNAVPFAAGEPGPDEVVVAIAAAGVNFSDVLKAMGLYPGIKDKIVPLGIECAGVVRRVGSSIKNFSVGDRVFGIVPYGFASEVVTPAYTLAKLPSNLKLDEAATIPIAIMTAHYALRRLADVQAGERVLIHAGAGGVGLAAIQIAQAVGAEVFATAGSESKRQMLRQLGVKHVYDSRTLDFAESIRRDLQADAPETENGRATNRVGIDVVLNSLPGEAIDCSLELLGPYGRFLEIGKTEIYQNRMIGLSPFQDNLSYHAIDLDRLLRQRPATVNSLWKEICEAIEEGIYEPLPMTVFDVEQIDDAFRYMAARRNIGKVVIQIADESSLISNPLHDDRADEGTVLITGGLGAIGMQLAEHIIANGDRHVALLSRSPASDAVIEKIAKWREIGVEVCVLKGDVAESLSPALSTLPNTFPPIDRVMHCAGVLADGLLFDMTTDQLAKTLRAKVDGTMELIRCLDHPNSAGQKLKSFVMFSSIASLLGSPGQANYAVANAFLDAIAPHLRQRGIAATSINFGPWAGAGMAGSADKKRGMDSRGVAPMNPLRTLRILDELIENTSVADDGNGQSTAVFIADWAKIGGGRDIGELPSLIRDLVSQATSDTVVSTDDTLRSMLSLLTSDERVERLLADFTDQLAKIMGLSVDQIDADASLAAVGLDSLMAIELKSNIEKRFKVVLPMARFMQGPSLKELATEVGEMIATGHEVTMIRGDEPADASTDENQLSDSLANGRPSDGAKPIRHELSGGQQALWFLNRLAPDSAAYNIADAVIIHGMLDRDAMVKAAEFLTHRHESFRTTFPCENGKPIAVVWPHSSVRVNYTDAGSFSEAKLDRTIEELVHRPFDLGDGPLLRIELMRQSDERHVLVFGVHHIIADFWSLVTLMAEFSSLYQEIVAGREISMQAAPHQYRHFVDFQQRLLTSPEGKEQRDYWMRALSGDLSVLDLPTDRPRPPMQTFEGRLAIRQCDAARSKRLAELARSASMTVNSLLLSAYQLLLHRISGQDEVLIGLPTSGRSRNELADVVGYFVNPVVVRSRLDGLETLGQFLKESSHTTIEAMANQDYPLARVVDGLKIDREPNRSTLFQAMFVMQKAQAMHEQGLTAFLMGQEGATMPVGDLTFESIKLDHYVAQFDLSLAASQTDEIVTLALQYNTSLFDAATAESMLDRMIRIVDSMTDLHHHAGGLDVPLDNVDWVSDEEREILVGDWGTGPLVSSDPPLVHVAFEEHVLRTPDAIAVIDSRSRWTYRELNERANRLADRLIGDGLSVGMAVGVCLPRCNDLLAAILGVLKAGGCYVPLDPDYPPSRLQQIVSQTEMFALVTKQHAFEATRRYDPEEIFDGVGTTSNPNRHIAIDSPCYIIFTSGSTGTPKGALVKHRGFGNLVRWYRREMELGQRDRLLIVANHGFDLTQKNFFAPLAVGGRVVMSEPIVYDPKRIAEEVDTHGITLINATPSTVYPLVPFANDGLGRLDTIRMLVLGGESIDRDRLGKWLQSVTVYNSYGPTECSDVVAAHRVSSDKESAIPLGRPIDNVRLYVLDQNRNVVPVGVTGELYIGGDCVGGGYLNDDVMTTAKFVADPFTDSLDRMMYASGDLARWNQDGTLAFLGRRDSQIKIRGHRIELGEIESALMEIAIVDEACVTLRRDDLGERLVAYVVTSNHSDWETDNDGAESSALKEMILRELKSRLPIQAIPSAIVLLKQLPLSPHGKVDRKQLPAPEQSGAGCGRSLPPRTPLERSLAEIWSTVLRVDAESIGRSDNFFTLGGDSLLAIQLVNRLEEAHFRVSPALLMQRQSVAELADAIERMPDAEQDTIGVDDLVDRGPTTPLQRRLLDQSLANVNHRHLSVTVAIEGRIDSEVVRTAVSALSNRHRAMTAWIDESGNQRYGTSVRASEILMTADLSIQGQQAGKDDYAKLVRSAAELIRIDDGKPIRWIVAVMPGEVTWVTLIGNYLFLDPVSMRLLIEELGLLCSGQPLPPGRVLGPIEYAAKLAKLTDDGFFDDRMEGWIVLSKPVVPTSTLPTSSYADSRTHTISISTIHTSNAWAGVARIAQAIADGWQRVSGERGIGIDIETTGRNLSVPIRATGIVGRLVAMFPIQVVADQSAEELRCRLAGIPDDGVSFGWLKQMGSAETRETLESISPSMVRLNYLGKIADGAIDLVQLIEDIELRSSETDPLNHRMHPIEIDVMASGDRWSMKWTVPRNAELEPMITRWIEAVGSQLGVSAKH